MSSPRVIVFGATGAVGKHAALRAHKLGAHVTLALRDPSASVPALPDLPRLKADLTDPASVSSAVKQSSSTAAFVYTMSAMDETFTALRDFGITNLVLLSSWTIYPLTVEEGISSHAIPAKHARAELALQKVGLPYTAVRPMFFASNVIYSAGALKSGTIELLNPDGVWDYIAPEDIGTVAGTALVEGPKGVLPIIGPRLISQRDAWGLIASEMDKQVNVTEVGYEEYMERNKGNAGQESLAIGTVRTDGDKYPENLRREGNENMKKYLGRDAIEFKDWLKEHKGDFGQV